MLKDFRLFRRDPVQWTQVLIFVGLLFLYFVNIRRLRYDQYYVVWVNMVSHLNIAVVGLLLSTFTTRFIYPMVSLEGRRFWMLGLVGVRRETILWSKFAFAVGRLDHPLLAVDPVERHDARRGGDDHGRPPVDLRGPLLRPVRDRGGAGAPRCPTSARSRPRRSPPASAAR